MSAKADARLVLGGEPRVQLLPPEVGLREKARGMRRMSVLLLILVVVAVAAACVYSFFTNAQAQATLLSTQGESTTFIAEQAKYADVTRVSGLVDSIQTAEKNGASTEVLWANVMDAIWPSVPVGASISSATLTARAPWDPVLQPTGALRGPRVATFSLKITSPKVLDATTLARALTTVPGFMDSSIDSLSQPGAYSTLVTLNVSDKALSGRFATKDGAAQ
jgi:hypothetical protein